jgi:hypothetical protein
MVLQRSRNLSNIEAQLIELVVDSQVEAGTVSVNASEATRIFKAASPTGRLLLTTDGTFDIERSEHALAVDARGVLERRLRDDNVPIAASLRLSTNRLHALDLMLQVEVPRRGLRILSFLR